MLIRLRKDDPNPMYVQIADAIANEIDAGRVGSGERLPAARPLAASIGVNMHTVLKAYEQLSMRGLVEKRRGRGGVVVASRDTVRGMVESLAVAAKFQGLSQMQVAEMVEEAW